MGVAGALLLTRLMQSLLFGVTAADPLTFFYRSVAVALHRAAGYRHSSSACGAGRSGGVPAIRLGVRVYRGQ